MTKTNKHKKTKDNTHTPTHTHTHTHIDIFWQSRNKSDKKHKSWLDPCFFCFFLSLGIVRLIGSDCPSQSRDAISGCHWDLKCISRAVCRQCCCNRGRHSNAGCTRADNKRELCRIPRWLQRSQIQIWLSVFHKIVSFFLFSSFF